MRLYSGASRQFVTDTTQNRTARILSDTFFQYYGYRPPEGEVNAWRNSLKSMALVINQTGLDDHGILLEYQLPLTSKRLDCMVLGRDGVGQDRAVIIELKQWDRASAAEGENEVATWIRGSVREVLHPSAQVGAYKTYLEDGHTAFHAGSAPVGLHACAYLHNYLLAKDDVLLASKFSDLVKAHPIFGADDVNCLSTFLTARLAGGKGMEVLRRVEAGVCRPSKKLLDHVADTIRSKPQYVLLDEQRIVFDKVMARARPLAKPSGSTVLIVKGGPGTGKSVIAINLMAELVRNGLNAHYATGSRAFTETLRKILGTRASVQFKYFNSYIEAPKHEIDVLICDEAHRIRKTSDYRYTPAKRRTGRAQVDELLFAAKVVVFLLDEDQSVRPNEIGSCGYIREAAQRNGAELFEYELEAQFRCSGSDAFVNWLDNTLGLRRTANALWSADQQFDFEILPDPLAVEQAIRERVAAGAMGRITAGFCWPWSKPNPDGTLADDVVIGNYRRPWNAKVEATHLAKGIPKAVHWATDPGGINQIGCIYTAQGFEFDYVGVIFGRDLYYDLDRQRWTANPQNSADPGLRGTGDRFIGLVKNAYRVLLTRGLKGCFVCFLDRDTERFVKSRIEGMRVHEKVADGELPPSDGSGPS